MTPPRPVAPETPGPLLSVGFGALVFFVFSVTSSVIDLIPGIRSIRPSFLTAIIGLGILAISGRLLTTFKSRIVMTFVALSMWFVLCVPFSVWPGGAVATLVGPWMVAFLTLFMVGGLMQTPVHCRKIAHTIGYAVMILSVLALVRNEQSIEDRLMLGGSRYGNPNELALMGLTALPFLAFMAMRRGNGVRRAIGLLGFVPILLMIAKTASRAAMIASAVLLLTTFWSAGMAQKLKLLVVAAIAVSVLMVVLPPHITRRFVTMFGDKASTTQVDELSQATIESAESRRMLLMDSIMITFQRPLFGVGTGNFSVEQDVLARARGERIGNWHLTHNTYTQISSESGLPGLLFLLMAIFFTFRSLTATRRATTASAVPEVRDLGALALALRVSLTGYLTCACFDSLAYSPTLTLFTGMAVSLEYCALRQSPKPRPAAVSAQLWQVPTPGTLKRQPARQNSGSAIRAKSRN